MAGTIGVSFADGLAAHRTVRLSEALDNADDYQLNRLDLKQGDRVLAQVDTSPHGGGFDSYLRVFHDFGQGIRQIASNDNQVGLDAGVAFQASADGIYYVGISSAKVRDYDPTLSPSNTHTSVHAFDLQLTVDADPVLAPRVVVSSFTLSANAARAGDLLTAQFTIENQGGSTAAPGSITLYLAANNRFDNAVTLQTDSLPTLDAGDSFEGSFEFRITDPLPSLSASQVGFVGFGIDNAGPLSGVRSNDWASFIVLTEAPVPADASNNSRLLAADIPVNSQTQEVVLNPSAELFYRITLSSPGMLTAQVEGAGADAHLALLDADGRVLVESDGRSGADPEPWISQGLLNGSAPGETRNYYLRVSHRRSVPTSLHLTTFFNAATSRYTIPATDPPEVVVRGDVNGDSRPDLVFVVRGTTAVTVLFGNGDGSFQTGSTFDPGLGASDLLLADFNHDGRLDLALTTSDTHGVVVMLGDGQGNFASASPLDVHGGKTLVAGDFNNDGFLDLALADADDNQVMILAGDNSGGFQLASTTTVLGGPASLVAGDFDRDGHIDLAVASEVANSVVILRNRSDGTFDVRTPAATGTTPIAIVAGDWDGDGLLDVAVCNLHSDNITVLYGDGLGGLGRALTYATGQFAFSIKTGEFNGDGRLDLVIGNSQSNSVSVLLANANGNFNPAQSFSVGANPLALAVGDWNADGRVDLATAEVTSRSLTLLLGHGNGLFAPIHPSVATGQNPRALVKGDFDGDGRLDLATVNANANDVTVLMGQGDGSFLKAGSFTAGASPRALVAGDFNGDGRLDLAVASYGSNEVAVFLGNGDGWFDAHSTVGVGLAPLSLIAADFNRDGKIDLATANYASSDLSILIGDGRGGFSRGDTIGVGSSPLQLVAGDFDGDTKIDLAVANYYSNDVSVLLGKGNGHFQTPTSVNLGDQPLALVAGHFNSDDYLDLAVATNYSSGIDLLLNDQLGHLLLSGFVPNDAKISSLAVVDANQDGRLDLLATNTRQIFPPFSEVNTLALFEGDGAGGFTQGPSFATDSLPAAVVAADWNSDGRDDLAVANAAASTVTVLLGDGDANFLSANRVPGPIRSTPWVANLTFDATPDAVVLTQSGRILFRRGSGAGEFVAPIVLNPDPNRAARDLTLVASGARPSFVAALDSEALSRVPQVTLYLAQADGHFTSVAAIGLPQGSLPANICSKDLNGDGLGDLIITDAKTNQVFVSLQSANQSFGPLMAYTVGAGPSDLAVADLNGDSNADLIITSRVSGQVSILLNRGNGLFRSEQRFRASDGLYGSFGQDVVESQEGTNGVVVGPFDTRPGDDLVVVNEAARTVTLLSGAGGGVLNPISASVNLLTHSPTAVAAGPLVTGDPTLYLAVLSKDDDSVTIVRNEGAGRFTRVFSIGAGNQPTGLSIADVSRPGGGGPDGKLDLLIGNAFGDLLILTGNGDGTFSEYRRAVQNLSLAASSSGTQTTFYFGNEGTDHLSYQTVATGTRTVANPTVYGDRTTGVLAPGPQSIVTVGGAQYLVVANTGANNLLVYRLRADGQPILASKQVYYTGTTPESFVVTSSANGLNGDSIPDVVVANSGSNDVSVFIGEMKNGAWTLSYRPRQDSGGLGPTAVAIVDVTGVDGRGGPDGRPDLLVTNTLSNKVTVLAQRGDGFFIEGSSSFDTDEKPVGLFVGRFDRAAGLDLVTVSASNTVSLISNFLTDPVAFSFHVGGIVPLVATALDFDRNGFTDLLVTNPDRGTLELLVAGGTGFEVAESLALSTHLSDLVLVTAGNELSVYGVAADHEVALLLATFRPPQPPVILPKVPGLAEETVVPTSGSVLQLPAGALVPKIDLYNQRFEDLFFSSRSSDFTSGNSDDDRSFDTTGIGGEEEEEEASVQPRPLPPGQNSILLLNILDSSSEELIEPDPLDERDDSMIPDATSWAASSKSVVLPRAWPKIDAENLWPGPNRIHEDGHTHSEPRHRSGVISPEIAMHGKTAPSAGSAVTSGLRRQAKTLPRLASYAFPALCLILMLFGHVAFANSSRNYYLAQIPKRRGRQKSGMSEAEA